MFGGIVYGLVGFVPSVVSFWKFLLALVLFNLTTASVVLWLSIAFASVSVASLVGTLIMLFKYVCTSTPFCIALDHYLVRSLLFTGLLINRDSMSVAFRWLHNISFFHAAFEALAVNELRYLQLKEMKVRSFLEGQPWNLADVCVCISMESSSMSRLPRFCPRSALELR